MGDYGFIDIVLFAMIAAFLILRLRSVLGKHRNSGEGKSNLGLHTLTQSHKTEKQPAEGDSKEESKIEPQNSEKDNDGLDLAEIKGAIPGFEKGEFLAGVRAAFEIIVNSFSSGDKEKLAGLLSDEVFNNFSSAITDRERLGHVSESSLIRIIDTVLLEANISDGSVLLTVKILSEQINATKGEQGEVVDGNPDLVLEVADIWTFSKEIESPDPNWRLVATRSLE
jgi:predicted lipid-binding transport protein (Tim44 family)